MSTPASNGSSTPVPRAWRNEFPGESDPGETWTLEVEHDCMSESQPFIVSVMAEQHEAINGEQRINATLICLSPGKAREVAAALLTYAHLADQANERVAKHVG